MIFCSLSSGSKGNAYVIKTEEVSLLVDAGISGRKITQGLEALGIEKQDFKAVMITHEHTDHVKGLRIVGKKYPHAEIYMSKGTWTALKDNYRPEKNQIHLFHPKEKFVIGDVVVAPFSIHHDAVEPVGFILSKKNKKIGFITDTGHICDEIFERIKYADLLILEANHDEEVLKMCSYPYEVKRRILSEIGHISNITAGRVLCRILEDSEGPVYRQVLLAHMSMENNTPEMAHLTIESILRERGLFNSDKIKLDTLEQGKISLIYEV